MAEEKQKKDAVIARENEKTEREKVERQQAPDGVKPEVSETWAEETIADLDEFIESQGIYIRQ